MEKQGLQADVLERSVTKLLKTFIYKIRADSKQKKTHL
jgi:hypothetical protein